ncbi:uncharacterized protein LOC135476787 [Liolophura sinensis]|uniref:uncharacterized protein LOC135476787 n=1 Tax=Liolophura sinensis TaxID=3198878 RepID=UPI0031583495
MSENHSIISIDEFDEPAQLTQTFCAKLSEEEYEEQTATETEKALEELMAYIERNPEAYGKVLQKRKQDEQEEAGVLSYLKVKMVSMFTGGVYPGSEVTSEELNHKVAKLKTSMTKVFNYSQETKGRRTSKRLAEKRGHAGVQQDENCPIPVAHIFPTNTQQPVPPPPPPPPPCLPEGSPSLTPVSRLIRTPLRDKNAQMCTASSNSSSQAKKTHVTRALRSNMGGNSTSSLSSLNSELNSSNPLKRLRATGLDKSPGGTPARTPVHRRRLARHGSGSSLASFNLDDPLHLCFQNILEQKFRNVRSPSPVGRFNNATSPATSFINSQGFTP